MNKRIIRTEKAPKPIGPYSQAVVQNELVFVSGQIAIDPQTGKMIEGGVKEQTTQVMNNVKAILEAADSSMEKVLKTSIFVSNIDFFSTVSEIYEEFFEKDFPARETVEVSALPMNADVEISVTAQL
ncbi:hypothetical protein LCGC14_0934670 [marine sediment metagenome]|uniref:Uncharacterized protein n=1 Tax=marine sediment metagenome TaxID=412755 RepID=A0A0F9R5E6_9ZZZZ